MQSQEVQFQMVSISATQIVGFMQSWPDSHHLDLMSILFGVSRHEDHFFWCRGTYVYSVCLQIPLFPCTGLGLLGEKWIIPLYMTVGRPTLCECHFCEIFPVEIPWKIFHFWLLTEKVIAGKWFLQCEFKLIHKMTHKRNLSSLYYFGNWHYPKKGTYFLNEKSTLYSFSKGSNLFIL